MSMATALEVRSPFLDHRVHEFAAAAAGEDEAARPDRPSGAEGARQAPRAARRSGAPPQAGLRRARSAPGCARSFVPGSRGSCSTRRASSAASSTRIGSAICSASTSTAARPHLPALEPHRARALAPELDRCALRPRVVFAIGGLGRGGSERQLMQLVAAAHPERIEAVILTFSTGLRSRASAAARRARRRADPALALGRSAGDAAGGGVAPNLQRPAARTAGRRLRLARGGFDGDHPSRAVPGDPAGDRAPQRLRFSEGRTLAVFSIPIRLAERRAQLVTRELESGDRGGEGARRAVRAAAPGAKRPRAGVPLPPPAGERSQSDTSPTIAPKRGMRGCSRRWSWFDARAAVARRPGRDRARCASRSPPKSLERGLAGPGQRRRPGRRHSRVLGGRTTSPPSYPTTRAARTR